MLSLTPEKPVAINHGGVRQLIVALAVVLALSWLSSQPIAENFPWYLSLQKPWFNPSPWVFSVVWPILYILMTCAAWHVWQRRDYYDGAGEEALALFAFQLVANFFWPLFFFGMQSVLFGLLWVVLVWSLVTLNIYFFFRLSRLSAFLLIPYWLWVSFATWLSYTVWSLNS